MQLKGIKLGAQERILTGRGHGRRGMRMNKEGIWGNQSVCLSHLEEYISEWHTSINTFCPYSSCQWHFSLHLHNREQKYTFSNHLECAHWRTLFYLYIETSRGVYIQIQISFNGLECHILVFFPVHTWQWAEIIINKKKAPNMRNGVYKKFIQHIFLNP